MVDCKRYSEIFVLVVLFEKLAAENFFGFNLELVGTCKGVKKIFLNFVNYFILNKKKFKLNTFRKFIIISLCQTVKRLTNTQISPFLAQHHQSTMYLTISKSSCS